MTEEKYNWALDPMAELNGQAYIQWKGTNVCMDLDCLKCGRRIHVDDDFAYNVRCAHCNQLHEMHSFVGYRLAPSNDENGAEVIGDDGESKWFVESDGPHAIGTYPNFAPSLPDEVRAELEDGYHGPLGAPEWVAICDCGMFAIGRSEDEARANLPCWEGL